MVITDVPEGATAVGVPARIIPSATQRRNEFEQKVT